MDHRQRWRQGSLLSCHFSADHSDEGSGSGSTTSVRAHNDHSDESSGGRAATLSIATSARPQYRQVLLCPQAKTIVELIVNNHRALDWAGRPAPAAFCRLAERADVATLLAALSRIVAVFEGADRVIEGVMWVTLLHLISRRSPVATATHMVCSERLKCTAENASKVGKHLKQLFQEGEVRWDTKRPCGGFGRYFRLIQHGWEALRRHGKQMSALHPSLWTVSAINERLLEKIVVLRLKAGYHRAHHLRLLPLCVPVIFPGAHRPAPRPGDMLGLHLLPGYQKEAVALGLASFRQAWSACERINRALITNGDARAVPYDVYDLTCAVCLRHAPHNYHRDEGQPFKVRLLEYDLVNLLQVDCPEMTKVKKTKPKSKKKKTGGLGLLQLGRAGAVMFPSKQTTLDNYWATP